jgi:low affinity Fe/Cu permease
MGRPSAEAPPVVFESAPHSLRLLSVQSVAGTYRSGGVCHIAAAAGLKSAGAVCGCAAYRPGAMHDAFLRLAARVTNAAGSPFALLLAAVVILTWLITGPLFGFSDTWQLVINTATTIVTFLMVFVIQATTNREMKAIQIKLDELIRAVHGARNAIIATDLIPEKDVEELQKEFEEVGRRAQAQAGARSQRAGSGAVRGKPKPRPETANRGS